MEGLIVQINNSNNQYRPLNLIPKCTTLKELKQIQAYTIKTNLQYEISILSNLINSCLANPTTASIHHAHHLFDQIPQPDTILFNTLAKAYARSNTPILAVELFSGTISSDRYTFPTLLKACAAARALQEAKQLHSLAIKRGLSLDAFVVPALIAAYSSAGDVISARRAFDCSSPKCAVAYNAIISGYSRNSLPNEALALFRDFQASVDDLGPPTYVTMLSVLSSCAMLGALGSGRWAHEYAKKLGLLGSVKLDTALVDMYSKCGSIEDAEAVFASSLVKDTPAWSTMIVALGAHGKAQAAFELFDKMLNEGNRPDEVTFLGLLQACSHAGMIQRGLEIFHSMRDKHGVAPKVKHFGCVVDLLGRAGRLREAHEFIEQGDFVPGDPIILWRTLLSACCTHGDFELGKRVMAQILEIDDSHGGDYVMFSNLCAKSGRREEVDAFRREMKNKGAVKVPGCSSIEVNNVVHEFFAGDGERHVSRELDRFLGELVKDLKTVGYVPDVSLVAHEIGDEEKELSLRYHSEKLAIAYGLLNTPKGTTIRVVKNLRVCGDCHSAAKLVSLVKNSVIILRDVQRFHHFKEGKCSCGDYW